MHIRSKAVRIFKFLAKAIAGLALLLLILLFLIHIPSVQNRITRKITSVLASKTEGRVDVRSIRFSIFGDVTIQGMKVIDADQQLILSVDKLSLTSDIFDLLSRRYIFDELRIEGINGHLTQDESGLNLQFLFDAFTSKEVSGTPSIRDEIVLVFKKISIADVDLAFFSTVSESDIEVGLGNFSAEDILLSLNPDKLKAGKVLMDQASVSIVSATPLEVQSEAETEVHKLQLIPNLDLGMEFEIDSVWINESDFAFHRGQVATTAKFDPSHLELKDIQIGVNDLLIRKDTLAAIIQDISASTPGIILSTASGKVELNRNRMALSSLVLETAKSSVAADIVVWNDPLATDDSEDPDIDITAKLRIDPLDLGYFVDDEVLKSFETWEDVVLDLKGKYAQGNGKLETLTLTTSNSNLYVAGMINDIWDPQNFDWEGLDVKAIIGPDFTHAITPFLGDLKLPPGITFQGTSTGSVKSIYVDGKVNSAWGNVVAKGSATPMANNIQLDMHVVGDNVRLQEYIDLPWLGLIDISIDAKGTFGHHQDAEIKGLISSVQLIDQPVHDIAFNGRVFQDSVVGHIDVKDSNYLMQAYAEVSFAGPLRANSKVAVSDFNIGKLLNSDSTILISGDLLANVIIDGPSIEGDIRGSELVVEMESRTYALDTLMLDGFNSPDSSRVDYYADDARIHMDANFELLKSPDVFKSWAKNILVATDSTTQALGSKTLNLSLELEKPDLFHLMGMDIKDFSSLHMEGNYEEQKQGAVLQVTSGTFVGYGVSLDTIFADISALGGSISANLNADHVEYSTFDLGDLDIEISTNRDTVASNILLSRDSVSLVDLQTRILPVRNGVFVYPDKLKAFGMEYLFEWVNPIFVSDSNVVMDHFMIKHGPMQTSLNGDLNAFEADFRNIDLTDLDKIFFQDSTIINSGQLNGMLSYVRDQQLDMKATIDSLRLYQSEPMAVVVSAVKEDDQVPFSFLMTNAANKVNVEGKYLISREEVDATLVVDVKDLEMFSFLVEDVLDEMKGGIQGEVRVRGPISKPVYNGKMRFLDAAFTTSNPAFTFNVKDDVIILDTTGLSMKDFTIYDEADHPLTMSGFLTTNDFPSFAYSLDIKTDEYTLMNTPPLSTDRLSGLLEIAADVQLKGNERDRYVNAAITIMDTTNLTYVVANDEIDLLKTEGIIEFVDPAVLLDSTALEQSAGFYDSLVASLPDFNLNATITIEQEAMIRIITNAQSGDYLVASGGAVLELGYDRTGTIQLTGLYTIDHGIYRVSFYDLVKKNFQLVKGSTINWRGSPQNGDLDIKAAYTVASNSIGLIGHEVAENEQTIYKRSLDYEVGINIQGTIEKPIVSFSLDLPKEEKTNYPVLANKLERLKLPEYQSELNKQVFGLLALGGFLPETSGSDVDQGLIATTALTNSVNSLLAGQLNRFAGQYIKGVNIDVGLQSYSDYSTPGGKTTTAMDFRVSKSILDDRLSFEIGGDFDINADQSGGSKGDNYRGDVAIIYDLTGNGDKQLKLFNNETYDIIYQEIRNTGISLVFIREFNKGEKKIRRIK